MNKAVVVGRLTKDVELKTTAGGVSVCSFTIAVNRRFKNAEGNYDADFINCVAWRSQAEFLSKYFAKGSMVGIAGSIQTRSYDSDGHKVWVTEVVADEVSFVGSKKDEANFANETKNDSGSNDIVEQIESFSFGPTPADDDLPF